MSFRPYQRNIAAFLLLSFFAIGNSPLALAAKVHGRFTFGAYGATERYADTTTGSDKNDFMVASTRLFTKVSDWGDNRYELTTDFRDKHDFFDKLDKERLQLNAHNEFQVRQMGLRYPNAGGAWGATGGRFPLTEAGSVYVDGLQTEVHHSSAWTSAVFGGLNPKRLDQSYLEFNKDSNISGLYTTYQSKGGAWNKNFYATHAYVTQSYLGEIDRRYFFHNMNFQWQENSRIITLAYVDFVPRTNLQTGNLFWQQEFSRYFFSQVSLLGIDVIEYTRRQGIREQLTPSPYREAGLKLDYKSSPESTVELSTLKGRREFDSLEKTDTSLGISKSRVWNQNWDIYGKFGSRKNFSSDDQYARLGIGLFSRKWEGNIDLEAGTEKYNDGLTLHPQSVEVSVSNYFSKQMFATFSAQRAADERVTILAGFFKIGYRFGNQEIPPVRDGAPNSRGQL